MLDVKFSEKTHIFELFRVEIQHDVFVGRILWLLK